MYYSFRFFCHSIRSHSFVNLLFCLFLLEKQIIRNFPIDSLDGLNLLTLAGKYSDQVFRLKKEKKSLVFEIQFPMSSKTPMCLSSASPPISSLLNNKRVPLKKIGMLSPNSSRTSLATFTYTESMELHQSPVMGSFSHFKRREESVSL